MSRPWLAVNFYEDFFQGQQKESIVNTNKGVWWCEGMWWMMEGRWGGGGGGENVWG
jgi:hypothetical protein